MICILHGYLLDGSGSNLWTRSIVESLCRQGEIGPVERFDPAEAADEMRILHVDPVEAEIIKGCLLCVHKGDATRTGSFSMLGQISMSFPMKRGGQFCR